MFDYFEYIDQTLIDVVMTISLNFSWVFQKIYQQLFLKGLATAMSVKEKFKFKLIFLLKERIWIYCSKKGTKSQTYLMSATYPRPKKAERNSKWLCS